MWPQEVAHQDVTGLIADSWEARLLLLCSELCLASGIFKFLNRTPVWSLQDYIVITYTHGAHLTFPSVSFGFYFIPLAHPTSRNEEGHSMTVQKKDAGTSSSLKKWHVFLVFYVSPCFSVHYWLFHTLCYRALRLSLMYQNTVTVFVMYIVSRIKWNEMKWNVGSGCGQVYRVAMFYLVVYHWILNVRCCVWINGKRVQNVCFINKTPKGMIHLKKSWKPYSDSTIYFQTWIWNLVLKFFWFHTYCVPTHTEESKR